SVPWRGYHTPACGRAARWLRIPALRPVPPRDGGTERGVRAGRSAIPGAAAGGRDTQARADTAGNGSARTPGRPVPGAAVGRTEAAYCPGSGAVHEAADTAAGRAFRRAGRQGAQGSAPLAAYPAR